MPTPAAMEVSDDYALHEEKRDDEKEVLSSTSLIKYASMTLMVGVILFVIIDSIFLGISQPIIISFLKWVKHNPWPGVFAFAGVYFLCTILLIPGTILTLGAGYVFGEAFGLGVGMALATLSVFLGASSGAIAAFFLGKYIFHEAVQKWLTQYPIMKAVDDAIEHKGFRIMLLLRLSPLIPFNAINYVMAATRILPKDYVHTIFGILPGTVAYVFIGTSTGSYFGGENESSETNDTIRLVALIVGIILAIIATIIISYYARLELKKILDEEAARRQEEQSPIHL